eukprot:SAG31_NODE_567_length_14028_cov_4.022328_8_plen_251_part_00
MPKVPAWFSAVPVLNSIEPTQFYSDYIRKNLPVLLRSSGGLDGSMRCGADNSTCRSRDATNSIRQFNWTKMQLAELISGHEMRVRIRPVRFPGIEARIFGRTAAADGYQKFHSAGEYFYSSSQPISFRDFVMEKPALQDRSGADRYSTDDAQGCDCYAARISMPLELPKLMHAANLVPAAEHPYADYVGPPRDESPVAYLSHGERCAKFRFFLLCMYGKEHRVAHLPQGDGRQLRSTSIRQRTFCMSCLA